jgi:hypothetical protein
MCQNAHPARSDKDEQSDMMAQTTQQVPYWLQLATVFVAPALGVMGVILGSLHSGKRETGRWLAEKRFALYTKFVNAATDANWYFWYTAHPALQEDGNLPEAHKQLLQYFRQAEQLSREIGLVCSSGVRTAMYKVLDNLSYKCLLLQDDQFRMKEADKFGALWFVSTNARDEGWHALLEFQQHSARELNVRDRRAGIVPQTVPSYHRRYDSTKPKFPFHDQMHPLR